MDGPDGLNKSDEQHLQELEVQRRQGELIHAIEQKGIGDILKPLTQEIFLFDTYVAGTTNLADPSVLKDVKAGDKLTLRREDNRYDEHAIMVLDSRKRKLGYIPERHNIVFSRLMDAGKLITATVTDVEPGEYYTKISINLYLVDF